MRAAEFVELLTNLFDFENLQLRQRKQKRRHGRQPEPVRRFPVKYEHYFGPV